MSSYLSSFASSVSSFVKNSPKKAMAAAATGVALTGLAYYGYQYYRGRGQQQIQNREPIPQGPRNAISADMLGQQRQSLVSPQARLRAEHQQQSMQPNTVEYNQRQRHLSAMSELQERGPVSKRPYYWAQSGNRDQFTQAVARNMIALSKERHSPATKQGVGPLLVHNEESGLQMMVHREQSIRTYGSSLQRMSGHLELYRNSHDIAQSGIDSYRQRRAEALPDMRGGIDEMHEMDLQQVADMRRQIAETSLEHELTRDKLEATRKTQISWPGHEDWESVKKSMRGSASKLLTLGHGNRNLDYVADEIAHNQPHQIHHFDHIVDSQIASGLPLDNVAKRLDACHASANPMPQETVNALRSAEHEDRLSVDDRRDFLGGWGSSTQKMAQVYFDKGVAQPNVKGASATVARFPNTRANPTYINQVTIDDRRQPRRNHVQEHEPVYRRRPSE